MIAVGQHDQIRLKPFDAMPEPLFDRRPVKGITIERDGDQRIRKAFPNIPTRVILLKIGAKKADLRSPGLQPLQDMMGIDPTPAHRRPIKRQIDERNSVECAKRSQATLS